MSATPKIKWFGTIIVAGILLVLAVMGGKWGTTYSANAGVNVAPHIDSINPFAVPAGSPETTLIITGSNFVEEGKTVWVRLKGSVIDRILTPESVLPTGISVKIPADLLVSPNVYILTVLKYTGTTMPTIPTIPPPNWEISNEVPFTVFNPIYYYYPLIFKG